MTERDIQRALILDRYRRSFVLPNYTPKNWFECDVFEITKADYFIEFEIKLTASDFKADAKKYNSRWTGELVDGRFQMLHENKHDLLGTGAVCGPNRFFYVLAATETDSGPTGIIPVERIPQWAGLIYATERPGYSPPWNIRLQTVRSAPRLHQQAVCPQVRQHAQGISYWRFHKLFLHNKLSLTDNEPIQSQ